MLFSAWHAATQASQPVQRSKSIVIPQRCSIGLPVTEIPVLAVRVRVLNQLVALAETGDTDARAAQYQCSCRLFPGRCEDLERIRPATICIPSVVRVAVADAHAHDAGNRT